MTHSSWLYSLLMLVISTIQAADQAIVVTSLGDTTLAIKQSVRLDFSGLTEAEFRKVTVVCTPSGSCLLEPIKSIDDKVQVLVTALKPGNCTITFALNGSHVQWRESLEKGLAEAGKAAVDAKLLAEWRVVADKSAAAYVTKTGSITLTIQSPTPVVVIPPRPDPGPPVNPPIKVVPVTSGTIYTVVIRMPDTITANQAKVLQDLLQWSAMQDPKRVTHFEFPPDAIGGDGLPDVRVQSYVRQMPAGSRMPFVFISQARTSEQSVILEPGFELPISASTVIAKMEAYLRRASTAPARINPLQGGFPQ